MNETPAVYRWIKTDCGRAKYADLAARQGPLAWLRLAWFVVVAALRDWRLPQNPEHGAQEIRGNPDRPPR